MVYIAVLKKNDELWVHFPAPLKMKPIENNVFATADGEVLDLSREPITFRNIPARKIELDTKEILKELKADEAYHKASNYSLPELAIIINYAEGLEKAIEFIEKLVEIREENQQILLRLGKILYATGELEKAQRCFKNLLTKNEKNEQAFEMLEKTKRRMIE